MSVQQGGAGLSEPEQRFNRWWRELVDRAGGQSRVVNRLGWSSSTTSRDYLGKTLPTDERARQLCAFLDLGRAEQDRLLGLLEQARPAYSARRQDPGPGIAADPEDTAGRPAVQALVREQSARDESPRPAQVSGGGIRFRGRKRLVAATSAVLAVIAIAVVVLTVPWHSGLASSGGSQAAGVPIAKGSYPGLAVKAVPVKGSALTPPVVTALGHGTAGKTGADGYVFRNMKNPGLCLTAVDAGPAAGQDRDRVDVEACDHAANQVWIPEQWEASGSRFTWLVSLRYQSKCLNAQYISGRLANGHKTMLWDCYQSRNEYWDFGDWHQNVTGRGQAYPIFIQSATFCLDADKNDFGDGGDGAQVNIWNQYPAPNQFWSLRAPARFCLSHGTSVSSCQRHGKSGIPGTGSSVAQLRQRAASCWSSDSGKKRTGKEKHEPGKAGNALRPPRQAAGADRGHRSGYRRRSRGSSTRRDSAGQRGSRRACPGGHARHPRRRR